MKARIFANISCWLLIFPLAVAVMSYPFWFWHVRGTFFDTNGYTDPIAEILSYLTPMAVVGVSGLTIFWRYGLADKKHVYLAAATVLLLTLAPLIFVLWLFHKWNVLFQFSFVWWLNPVNCLWLSAYAMCLVTLKAGFVRSCHRPIPLVFYSSILLFLGAALAWQIIIQDFSLSLVNVLAIIPLTMACLSVVRSVFILSKKRAASRSQVEAI